MKRILHILPLSRRAGLEVMFLNYLKYMKEVNPELLKYQYVLGINTSEYFKSELIKLKVTLYEGKRKGKLDYSLISLGKRIIQEKNINIVYGQNTLGNTIACFLGILNRNLKVICHEHGGSWNVNGLNKLLTNIWITKAHVIICNSIAASILLEQRFNARNSKLKVILNGVIENQKEKIEKASKRLLFAGRLEEVKSPHTLIYMMEQLVQKDNQIVLDVIGDGKFEQELKDITSSYNLNNNIFFHGNVENVSEFMKQSTLLILPSVREPLGNVLIEAAFQETPSVATKIDGIPEVIVHEQTGILIKPTVECIKNPGIKYVVNTFKGKLEEPKGIDPKELSDEILTLLSDNRRLKKMGIKAKEHVSDKFSIERYYNEVKDIYLSLK